MTETLYKVTSKVDRWEHRGLRYAGVYVTWLRSEPDPAVPYEQAIQAYTPGGQSCYLEETISELFTLEEAQQLQAYLLETFGTQSSLEAVSLPIPQDSPLGPGVLPLGGTRDTHDLSQYEGYSLPFQVKGFYDVEGYSELPRAEVHLAFSGPTVTVTGLEYLSREERESMLSAFIVACAEADRAEQPPAVRLSISGCFFRLPCALCGQEMETGGIEIVQAGTHDAVCSECAERLVPQVKALQDVCQKWERYFWYATEAETTGDRLNALLEQESTYTLTAAELEARITDIIRACGLTPEQPQSKLVYVDFSGPDDLPW